MKTKDKEREKEDFKRFQNVEDPEDYEQMMDDYLEDTFRNNKRKPRKKDGWS